MTLLTWAGYNTSQQRYSTNNIPGIGALLPLFNEEAATIFMIKHGIDIVEKKQCA